MIIDIYAYHISRRVGKLLQKTALYGYEEETGPHNPEGNGYPARGYGEDPGWQCKGAFKDWIIVALGTRNYARVI